MLVLLLPSYEGFSSITCLPFTYQTNNTHDKHPFENFFHSNTIYNFISSLTMFPLTNFYYASYFSTYSTLFITLIWCLPLKSKLYFPTLVPQLIIIHATLAQCPQSFKIENTE